MAAAIAGSSGCAAATLDVGTLAAGVVGAGIAAASDEATENSRAARVIDGAEFRWQAEGFPSVSCRVVVQTRAHAPSLRGHTP